MEGCREKWAEMDRVCIVLFCFFYYSVPAFEFYQREQEAAGPIVAACWRRNGKSMAGAFGPLTNEKTQHADMINLKEREAPREAPEGSRVDQRGRWWKLALGRPSVSDTTNPSAERPRVSSGCVRMEALSDQEFVFESYCYYHY